MQKYLRDSFARNKPYDQMVYELVTATGANKPGEEDFNGEVNFLIGNMDDKRRVNATAKTAKVFLGLQVQCTQCHNHPFNDWKQNQFWELNAFFRQTGAAQRGDREKAPEPYGGIGKPRFSRRSEGQRQNDPTKADAVLRTAQRPVEIGVPGVRRRHGDQPQRPAVGGESPRLSWRSSSPVPTT